MKLCTKETTISISREDTTTMIIKSPDVVTTRGLEIPYSREATIVTVVTHNQHNVETITTNLVATRRNHKISVNKVVTTPLSTKIVIGHAMTKTTTIRRTIVATTLSREAQTITEDHHPATTTTITEVHPETTEPQEKPLTISLVMTSKVEVVVVDKSTNLVPNEMYRCKILKVWRRSLTTSWMIDHHSSQDLLHKDSIPDPKPVISPKLWSVKVVVVVLREK